MYLRRPPTTIRVEAGFGERSFSFGFAFAFFAPAFEPAFFLLGVVFFAMCPPPARIARTAQSPSPHT
jgi:hypothetical protein